MINTDHPLYRSFSYLSGYLRDGNTAAVIGLTSAYSGTGTSHTARELAMLAAQYYSLNGGRVALVDFDIANQTQKAFFDTPVAHSYYGDLTAPYDANFGQTPFWQITDSLTGSNHMQPDDGSAVYGLYLVGDTGLAVTYFDWAQISQEHNVNIVSAPNYWTAIRQQFSLVIVDCPAFDRSDTAIHLIQDADSMVLVSSPQ